MKNRYIDEFLKFNCANDILTVTGKITNASKEISEAMAIRRVLKNIALHSPMKYSHTDLCSGNGLVGLFAIFTLPLIYTQCIDIKKRDKSWNKVKNFEYREKDIYLIKEIDTEILTACHSCGQLSIEVIRIFNNSPKAKYLVLIPCCSNNKEYVPQHSFLQSKLTPYEYWCYYLSQQIMNSKVKIFKCFHIVC